MFPLPIVLGGAAVLGGLYALTANKKSPPVLQARTGSAPNGAPIKVVVPVDDRPPQVSQSAVPIAGPVAQVIKAQPTNTGTGASYAPKATVASSSPGQLRLEPIVISPSGASTLAVQTWQDVQNALNTLGMAAPPLVIDGKVGPKTSAALTRAGLSPSAPHDQIMAALQDKLAHLAATDASIGTAPAVTTASPTTQTPIVTNVQVQHALNLLGASPALTEDGKIGPMSTAAIRAFQISHGLVADGIAGPKTKAALSLALSQKGLPVG